MKVINRSKAGPYYRRMLNLFGTAIVAYWPMWEASGTTVTDSGSLNCTGTYSGPTLAQPGIGDGRTAPLFDGNNDWCNMAGANLADAFDGATGTLMYWLRAYNAGVWTDATERRMFFFQVDGNNYLSMKKSNIDNRCYFERKAQGGTWTGNNFDSLGGRTDWIHCAVTWDESVTQLKCFIDASQVGGTQTTNGTWTGSLASVVLGAAPGPAAVWYGWLAHFIILKQVATPAEIIAASRV